MAIDTDLAAPFVGTEIDNTGALTESTTKTKRAVLIGIRLAAGATAEGVPVQITGNSNSTEADAAFGRASMIAQMARAFRAANPRTECWAIAVDEPSGGTAGTQTLTVAAGTATAAGTIYIYIGSRRIPVDIAVGDDNAAIAASIDAAVNEVEATLPVTAGVSLGVVTLTARHKGLITIPVSVNGHAGESLPAGVGAIAVATGASAAGEIDVTPATDVLGSTAYDRLVLGFHSDTVLDSVEATLAARWAANVETDGVAICAYTGRAFATVTTYTTAPARNSPYSVIVTGESTTTPGFEWDIASKVAGLDLAETYVNTPRQWLTLPGELVGVGGTEFSLAQRSLLIKAGAATLKKDASGTLVVDRLVTTYQQNGAGAPDPSYQDLTTMSALSYARWAWRTRIQLKYPRALLGDDGTVVSNGAPVVTPSTIKAEASAFFDDLAGLGLFESATKDQFLADLTVVRPGGNVNRLDAVMSPDLLNKFLQMATTLRYIL